MTLDRLSNQEPVEIDDSWIEEAAVAFKEALRKQLKPFGNVLPNGKYENKVRDFGLRMSNFGRPSCVLQNEQQGIEGSRNDYNHIVRMLLGDITEITMVLLLKAAQINITNQKQKHDILVDGKTIPGEDDIEIDGKVYDIKSSSPYAFTHKWSEGWNGVYYGDTFGYVSQLWGYADKNPDKMGGWIVVDKSSGEVKVVTASPTVDQLNEIAAKASATVDIIENNRPFIKCFEPEEETFYKKPTGNLLVPTACTFCKFLGSCWPEAQLRGKALSKSSNPKQVWYVSFNEDSKVEETE